MKASFNKAVPIFFPAVVREIYRRFFGSGTENFWLIWSKEKSEAAEDSRADAFRTAGKINDGDLSGKLKDYLKKELSDKAKTSKDVERKLTKIDFEGNSIVYLIQLEHR